MNIIEKFGLSNGRSTISHQDQVAILAERIYGEILTIIRELDQLQIEDYDLSVVKTALILPIAEYLHGNRSAENPSWTPLKKRSEPMDRFIKPIFVSGDPGIGKTTLLMVLDEALARLGLGSCRDLVAFGEVTGYFANKAVLSVTPLTLFGKQTGVLSARDWNNVLRHWTFDESIGRESEAAFTHFIQQLQGKVVIIDEAELEGYVYFTEILAQHGVLVFLSSNLSSENIHLDPDHVRVVELKGLDHRNGDIAKVCLPNTPHELFTRRDFKKTRLLAGAGAAVYEVSGKRSVLLDWPDLQNRPLMKDDFARFFRDVRADFVLLDGVPFFAEVTDIHLTFLGHLSRFVNFVDAIHDCGLPLLVRGTHSDPLDNQLAGHHLKAVLYAYDDRVGGHLGQAAWVEWTRCLSRLRSREALNSQFHL